LTISASTRLGTYEVTGLLERLPEPPNELVLVQHWLEELQRIVPTKN